MKKIHSGLASLVLLLSACIGNVYQKIKLELPPYSPLKLEEYQEIVITDFLVTKEPAGLDLNKEIQAYFRLEMEKKFKGKVIQEPLPLKSEEVFQSPDTWKPLVSASASRLIMTGKAALNEETRKAILSRPVKKIEETLSSPRGIEERRVYTLELTVYLLKPETGEAVLQRDFKESATYTNLQQRADFAFHDLAQRVRVKFFRPLLGEARLQERYLLLK